MIKERIDALLIEKSLSISTKAKISRAKKGHTTSSETKSKISKTKTGQPSNFEGKKHTPGTKNVISAKRGHRDPIGNKRWVVNSKEKTYRKAGAPEGFKLGHRRFSDIRSK